MKTLGLYIHIPFCMRKCLYCDFVSFTGKENLIPQYIDALLNEAAFYKKKFSGYLIDTVYLGGGTPSMLPEGEVERLINGLHQYFHIKPDAQTTLEANPGTVTTKKLAEYKKCGVNRLSVGMQTDDDTLLQTLGRIHSHEQFLMAFYMSREAGFEEISIDLMFGLPGQTLGSFQNTLQNSIKFNPEHISVYALKVEKGTPFFKTYGDKIIVNEETERKMYHAAVRLLKKAGFKQYETSNFAKKGYESRHNLKYWRACETLGLGVAAHSYIIENNIPFRSQNTENIEEYFNRIGGHTLPIAEKNSIGFNEQIMEYIMLHLRMNEGIIFEDFNIRFNLDFEKLFENEIKRAEKTRLIHAGAKGIYPLLKGFDLQNTLIYDFIKKI